MRERGRRQTQEREERGRPPTAEVKSVLRERTVVIHCRDPRHEPEKISEIYDHVIAAKRECGEKIGPLSLELFTQFVVSRADQLKQKLQTTAIDFVVGVDNGRVKFSARAVEGELAR